MHRAVFSKLRALGAGDFQHLNGDLDSHLIQTYNLLKSWKNSEYVCIAGLYHAVYGTEKLDCQMVALAQRESIAVIVGKQSEELVYLYAACDRDYLYPQIGHREDTFFRNRFTNEERRLTSRETKDLLELTLANELEIVVRDEAFLMNHRVWYEGLFDRFSGIVSQNAFTHYLKVFGKD